MKTDLQVQQWPVEKLIPYARNARTHSEEQVAQVAASIVEFGWTNPILVGADGVIIAGHARLAAARKLKLTEVPVIVLDHLTPTQRRALVLADNRLALSAGWDEEMLRVELESLEEDGSAIGKTVFGGQDSSNTILRIAQRYWRGDIDDPKSKTSKRPLTLGYLGDRYRAKAAADNAKAGNWVFVRTDGSGLPLWDSGVRQALKRAAVAEGCDFPGLGPHSFRRANITWRQEVGGSSIEASKIAGHSTVRMTEEYTKIQLTRQEELTRLIQERLASAGEKQPVVVH